jgi:hypothetical protein
MAFSIVKAGAIAATLVTLSVSGAFAATWGVIDHDAKVKKSWSSSSMTVNLVEEGDEVMIIDSTKKNGGWYKIKIPGTDGWVKKSVVDIYEPDPGPGDEPGVKFCFTGPLGYVCVNN